MRLARSLLWGTSILLAVILVGCLLLFLFFPLDRYDEHLRDTLSAHLRLNVDFTRLRFFLKGGPGVSIEQLRLSPAGKQARTDAFFTASKLTFRPSLTTLAQREVAARFTLEAPAFHPSGQAGDAPLVPGILGAVPQGIDEDPKSLSDLIPLPAGFALTGANLEIRDGSLKGAQPEFSGLDASLRIERDLTFDLALREGHLRWNRDGSDPMHLSGRLSAEISGRAVSPEETRIAAKARLGDAVIEWQDRTVALPEPVKVSCHVEGKAGPVLSVPQLLVTCSGVEISMKGSTELGEGLSVVDIQDLRMNVEDWQPLWSLLSPETAPSGKLSLLAERLRIHPARVALPVLASESFRPTRPEGVTSEGLRIHFTEGSLSRTELGGFTTSLDGFELHIEQEDRGWTGTIEAAKLETAGPVSGDEAFRFSGPLSIKASWSEEKSAPAAVLVIDLTGGSLAYRNLIDKPMDVPLQLGIRARILSDEVRFGRAFLHLGDTEWTLKGSVREPSDPLLEARLTTNVLSLDALAAISPVAQYHDIGGRLEIKELAVAGRTGRIRKSMLLKARVAGKGLRLHGTSVKGLYVQAFFGKQTLSVSPVVIQPSRGMIDAVFSADFSQAYPQEGVHQYHGTLKIDHVDLDELARLAAPSLEGKARGRADVNLAFRGSGFRWPEAAATLEAKARIFLNHFALLGEDDPAGDSEESLSGQVGHLVEALHPQGTARKEESEIDPEQQDRLAENRAAGWFTMREGSISTRNLVAVHEGKLFEMQGSMDLSGHLHVDRGKLFVGGRMIPFQLECRLGKERCKPTPDLEEMGRSAAAELSDGIRTLSEGAAGVFKDLLF
jgi:hypothetical protein